VRKGLKVTALIVIVAVIALAGATYFSTDMFRQFGAKPTGARLAKLQASDLYDGKALQNPREYGSDDMGPYFGMMKDLLLGNEQRTPKKNIQTVALDLQALTQKQADGIRFAWIGHSTVLLEIDGVRILTDPVLSPRCSPSSLVGPKRFHTVNVPDEIFETLDAVLISHDHFDHLDMKTIERLAKFPVPFYVPLGVGAHLEFWGIASERIHEHEWGDSSTFAGDRLTLISTPARHFSGRATTRNQSLWSSWVIKSPSHSIYFSGDSGYHKGFREIGSRYGPFDFSMIEMAAYHEKYWPSVHMWPEQAVQAHQDVRAGLMLPVHWGTFNLAIHDWNEPAERLVRAANSAGIKIVTPRPGQLVDLAALPDPEYWWRD
jgi:L-ascorbate metabolism protein UlaG (beta-lactamase superfamily)